MFFSIPLCEGKIQKGRVDLKTNQNFALAHIAIYNIIKNSKCNVYFFIGSEGSGGVKKGYIITDRFGNFNNTIRFNRSNDFCPEDFNKVSLVLINSDDIVNFSTDIVGFRGARFDYKDILLGQSSEGVGEYCKNEKYDELIDSLQEYCPFLTSIENVKTVKINLEQFENLNFNCIKDSMKKYIDGSLKFYGFLIFGRYTKNDKTIYMLGIPDKYNSSQVIPMANMGSNKFYGIDLTKKPQNGDLGFWSIYL